MVKSRARTRRRRRVGRPRLIRTRAAYKRALKSYARHRRKSHCRGKKRSACRTRKTCKWARGSKRRFCRKKHSRVRRTHFGNRR